MTAHATVEHLLPGQLAGGGGQPAGRVGLQSLVTEGAARAVGVEDTRQQHGGQRVSGHAQRGQPGGHQRVVVGRHGAGLTQQRHGQRRDAVGGTAHPLGQPDRDITTPLPGAGGRHPAHLGDVGVLGPAAVDVAAGHPRHRGRRAGDDADTGQQQRAGQSVEQVADLPGGHLLEVVGMLGARPLGVDTAQLLDEAGQPPA
ncbi:hypothetical protein [Streptosporangium sp. NBC_01469]|uniref:hypothetical protein n=1 Tax=Streptosporangium sp. NBC_01469 TaxID=2903898 RepID=UPI002E2D49E8|nr:hypothetical protein [Streptosporangium sp. NBC_01469]